MQKLSIPSFTFATKTYCLLTKPGIIFGNLVTTAGGFALASRGQFNLLLFLATIIGLCLVIASACVFNNYIDRHADQKMERTKNRPLVKGFITPLQAIIFGLILGVIGLMDLALFTNTLTTILAIFGFLAYVFLYSFSKYYSIHGTLIGSMAGSIPPVVGYCAVSNTLDLGALILFLIITMWQMPHFFAIAIYRLDEYKAAAIPVLPLKKGIHNTKIQMLLYIIAFLAVASSLFILNFVGYVYLGVVVVLTLAWLVFCLKGFKSHNDKQWARRMFIISLVVVMGLCISIPFSVL